MKARHKATWWVEQLCNCLALTVSDRSLDVNFGISGSRMKDGDTHGKSKTAVAKLSRFPTK